MNITFYDIDDMTDKEIQELPQSTLKSLLQDCHKTITELEQKYYNGDRIEYPPDWYDRYIFPLTYIRQLLQQQLDNGQ